MSPPTNCNPFAVRGWDIIFLGVELRLGEMRSILGLEEPSVEPEKGAKILRAIRAVHALAVVGRTPVKGTFRPS